MGNPWGKTDHQMEQAVQQGWAAHAEVAQLRKSIRDMTSLLQGKEWAEHLSADPDISALESEITKLIGAAAPVHEGLTDEQIVFASRADAGDLDWNDIANVGATAVQRAAFRRGARWAEEARASPQSAKGGVLPELESPETGENDATEPPKGTKQ
jgi:hypothetical protein